MAPIFTVSGLAYLCAKSSNLIQSDFKLKSAKLTLVKSGGASLGRTCDDGHLGGRKKQETGVINIMYNSLRINKIKRNENSDELRSTTDQVQSSDGMTDLDSIRGPAHYT